MSRPESIIITLAVTNYVTEGKEYDVKDWSQKGQPQIIDDDGDLIFLSGSKWKPAPAETKETSLDFVPQLKEVLQGLLEGLDEFGDSTDVVGLTIDSKPVFKDQRTAKAVRKTVTIEFIQYGE